MVKSSISTLVSFSNMSFKECVLVYVVKTNERKLFMTFIFL